MRYSTYLEVDLKLLGKNVEMIQSLAPRAKLLPMVKSDAYGNGLIPVAKFLTEEMNIKHIGCATIGEAIALNEGIRNFQAESIVFSDQELYLPHVRDAYLKYKIIPMIFNTRDLEFALSDPFFKKLPLVIKFNTGMNRLGLTLEDLKLFLPKLKERGIDHFISHFARSSQHIKPGDKNNNQYQEFKDGKAFLESEGVEIRETSVSNSGAIEQGFGVDETYVRPGLMLYGPPTVTDPIIWNGHQISRLMTKVLFTFKVKKGTPIGYGVNVADKDSFIAVIAVGYGDGMMTFYSGTKLNIKGHIGKVFGRVNMDMTFLQFEPEAESAFKIDDAIEVWSNDNRVITDIAIQNKTTAYQIMCGITPRIPRKYI